MNRLGDGVAGDAAAARGETGGAAYGVAPERHVLRGREFVHVRESPRRCRRAVEEEGTVAHAPHARDFLLLNHLGRESRVGFRIPGRRGPTEAAHRAGQAEGFLAMADGRAEFHHRLIVVAGRVRREEGLGQGGEGLRRARAVAERRRVRGQAREDADHVPVDARGRRAEGDAGDRRRGVRSDAGQFPPGRGIARRRGHRRDCLGEAVEVARARVVAEAFPEFQHLRLRCGGQRLEVRQRLQPAREVGEHGLHLRLLQHEFAHDRPVHARPPPPREVTLVPAVPVEQRRLEGSALSREGRSGRGGHGNGADAKTGNGRRVAAKGWRVAVSGS